MRCRRGRWDRRGRLRPRLLLLLLPLPGPLLHNRVTLLSFPAKVGLAREEVEVEFKRSPWSGNQWLTRSSCNRGN